MSGFSEYLDEYMEEHSISSSELSKDINIEAVIRANREVFDKLRERNREDMKGIMWECLEPEIDECVDAKLAEKDVKLAEKDERLAEKEAELAEKDAEISRLLKRLAQVSCL